MESPSSYREDDISEELEVDHKPVKGGLFDAVGKPNRRMRRYRSMKRKEKAAATIAKLSKRRAANARSKQSRKKNR